MDAQTATKDEIKDGHRVGLGAADTSAGTVRAAKGWRQPISRDDGAHSVLLAARVRIAVLVMPLLLLLYCFAVTVLLAVVAHPLFSLFYQLHP